jgi:hypothetical protein
MKISKLFEEYDSKLIGMHYRLAERQIMFAKVYSKMKSFMLLKKKSVQPKAPKKRTSWEYMFERWLAYGQRFPDKKNSVCMVREVKLNNWVKEQRRAFTNDTIKHDRFMKLRNEGFEFQPRKKDVKESAKPISVTNHLPSQHFTGLKDNLMLPTKGIIGLKPGVEVTSTAHEDAYADNQDVASASSHGTREPLLPTDEKIGVAPSDAPLTEEGVTKAVAGIPGFPPSDVPVAEEGATKAVAGIPPSDAPVTEEGVLESVAGISPTEESLTEEGVTKAVAGIPPSDAPVTEEAMAKAGL